MQHVSYFKSIEFVSFSYPSGHLAWRVLLQRIYERILVFMFFFLTFKFTKHYFVSVSIVRRRQPVIETDGYACLNLFNAAA